MVKVHIPDVWRHLDCGKYVPLASFLLNIQSKKHMGTWRDSFIHEMDFTTACILVSEVVEADLILFPHWWSPTYNEELASQNRQVDELSRLYGCPVICQGSTADILNPKQVRLPFENGFYLSNMLISTRRPEKSIGLSFFIPDCRARYSQLQGPLNKSSPPSVGFCGVAAPLNTHFDKTKIFDYLRLGLTYATGYGIDPEEIARFFGNNTKHAYRARLIRQYKKHEKIQSDFLLRTTGGFLDNSYTNKGDEAPFNCEFYRNLDKNLYTICSRGTENYSIRFYETLCMGRIPIVIDTDMVLPFDDVIDYRKHCVWIERKQVRYAADILLDFHHNHNEAQLLAIQNANRILWESYLSHLGYYTQLVQYLKNRSPQQ